MANINNDDGMKEWYEWEERKRTREYHERLKSANLEILQFMSFKNYKPNTSPQQKAFDLMKDNHGSYYIFGPYGTGKTHLAVASALRHIKNDSHAKFISVPEWLSTRRELSNTERFNDLSYVCLDDFGKHGLTDWIQEQLYILMDQRWRLYVAGKGHTTITSQYPLDVLEKKIDGAIISRIRGMCGDGIFVDGEDFRLKGDTRR